MRSQYVSRLSHRQRYLQLAFNSTLSEARRIISRLPVSDRIIIEAGTPLIKQYGMEAVRALRHAYSARIGLGALGGASSTGTSMLSSVLEMIDSESGKDWASGISALTGAFSGSKAPKPTTVKAKMAAAPKTATGKKPVLVTPYIVADMKTMDRGGTEVEMVAAAGASAIIALGSAPTETLNAFIAGCHEHHLDAMVDMMNVEYPLAVLRKLKQQPDVVLLHRGVDEERDNREKQIPLHEIRRVKGNYDTLISIAGGDTPREVQRSVFNDADIVVVWKSVYHQTQDTLNLVEGFLRDIK